MSKISSARKQYRSMRGKQVDMDLLRKRNELTPAAGNAKVNARGDELGPGGKIIRKREDIVKEHYAVAGTAKRDSDYVPEETVEEQPVVQQTRTTKKSASPAEVAAEEASLDDQEEWIEDDDGNFVKKG